MRMPRPLLPVLIALSFLVSINAQDKPESERVESPKEFKALKYRNIGPAAGGRVSRAAGVPGNPLDLLRGHRVGRRLDVDRRRHDVEVGLRRSAGLVDRIDRGRAERSQRRSTSAPARPTSAATSAPATASTSRSTRGKTWTHVWDQEGQIGTMAVHPKNADVAFAAVLGHAFGPNPERGVYRTSDGGKTWQQVLKKDADTGASDVAIDPSNPNVALRRLLAGAPVPVGPAERRPRQRPLRLARRRRHLEAAHRPRPARRHLGQGRRGRRAVGRPPRLRAHRSRKGRAVPIRRRRRELGAGQPVARAAAARLVLHRRSP